MTARFGTTPPIFPEAEIETGIPSSRAQARSGRVRRRAKRRLERSVPLCASPVAVTTLQSTWLEHQDYFYRLCLGWTHGNVADAEDVIGQAWVKILELDLATAQDVRNPLSWISRILRNMCIDRQRTNSRSLTLIQHEAAVPTPAPTPTPDSDISRRQLADAIVEAVTRLPTNLREVVLLRLIQGQSYTDIGHALHISVPNARKRLQQARALLRPELAQFWDEREPLLDIH